MDPLGVQGPKRPRNAAHQTICRVRLVPIVVAAALAVPRTHAIASRSIIGHRNTAVVVGNKRYESFRLRTALHCPRHTWAFLPSNRCRVAPRTELDALHRECTALALRSIIDHQVKTSEGAFNVSDSFGVALDFFC